MFNGDRERAKDERGQDSGDVESTRRIFLETLNREIASFGKQAELHHARDVEITEPLIDG
jgi:hypothetical protein